ncbi:MAG: DUF262 domain-containing protein [Chitinophagales bacterium]|jgi:hypothetical protein|nr:DUF262 domain-containing protein [Chitinophagales bacterium]
MNIDNPIKQTTTLPEPQIRTFSTLLAEIQNGQTKIPQFQREFVWSLAQSANLMDSILKGYPIGTFIFWNTNERLRSVRDIGDFTLPEPAEGVYINYVLDGQQRLTSLFASLKGLTVKRDSGKIDDFSQMYIDLEANTNEQIVVLETSEKDSKTHIKITDLLYGGRSILRQYDEKYDEKIDQYKNNIQSYNYSIILLKNAPIDIATEVFARINEGGKKLSVFEIMVAKTYDYDRCFDLATKFKELCTELEPMNYETISDSTVLQTVSIILEKDCTKKQILTLDRKRFIDEWDRVTDAIKKSVEFFRFSLRIPVSQLLPFNTLIAPISYFFYHHKHIPTGNKMAYLEDYFWRCSLSARFSSSVEAKVNQDVKRIDEILNGLHPSYDWAIDASPEFIEKHGWFSASRSYIKAILCIYAYQQPRSFNTDALVNISNYWLTRANSKNYHHFFPQSYLQKKLNWENKTFYINHILNITIVDDQLNKHEIRAKAPSKYMKDFTKQNKSIRETMKSHLIDDFEEFGISTDNYEAFFHKRAKMVSDELKKRIIESKSDLSIEVQLLEFNEIEENDIVESN